MSIDKTLDERGAVYGDYLSGLILRGKIMELLESEFENHHHAPMQPVQYGWLWDQVNKLCRLAVSPNHIDSWHDIQGYARLVERILLNETAPQPVQHAPDPLTRAGG